MTRRWPLRVAMVGSRGVPATFGGIERHVEELGARLADRGHEVLVWCRTNYSTERTERYRGMTLRHLRSADTKHLDAITHTAAATVVALRAGVDVVHFHALGPGLIAPLPRYASTARVVQTVHGLDSERDKWSRPAAAVLRVAAWMSARVPDRTIVVSRDLARHYRDRYGRDTAYIPNGVLPGPGPGADLIRERWGLIPGSYLLFVGRLVPEKAPDLLIEAFGRVAGPWRLVLAGGSSHSDDYVRRLRAAAGHDERVILPGYVFGDALAQLYRNAAAFVLPSHLEGLPLTLLEAAACGTPAVASAIPPHLEILGCADRPGTRLFPPGDVAGLVAALERVLADPAAERAGGEVLREQVMSRYDWDAVTDETEQVYREALAARR